MTAEHTETRREEVVCGSGAQSDGHRGEYLRVPLRVRAVSIVGPCLGKNEPIKKMKDVFVCRRAVEP